MIRYITYYEWQLLLDRALDGRNGRKCAEEFIQSYPAGAGQAGGQLIYTQIGKFVTYTLNTAFMNVQKAVNECFDEMDLDIAEQALHVFGRKLRMCLYYNGISELEEVYKNQLNDVVTGGVRDFFKQFRAYIRKCAEESSDGFIEDLEYICNRIDYEKYALKFIRELKDN